MMMQDYVIAYQYLDRLILCNLYENILHQYVDVVVVLAIRTYTHRCLNVCVCACTEPNLLEGKICRPADILLNPPGFRISHTFYTCIRISRLIVDHAYVTFSAESKFRRVRNLYPPVRVCQCECVDCVQLPYSFTCVRECV